MVKGIPVMLTMAEREPTVMIFHNHKMNLAVAEGHLQEPQGKQVKVQEVEHIRPVTIGK